MFSEEFVEILLRRYSANSGNNFSDHYNQGAARQWMADALEEARVCSAHDRGETCQYCGPRWDRFTRQQERKNVQ